MEPPTPYSRRNIPHEGLIIPPRAGQYPLPMHTPIQPHHELGVMRPARLTGRQGSPWTWRGSPRPPEIHIRGVYMLKRWRMGVPQGH